MKVARLADLCDGSGRIENRGPIEDTLLFGPAMIVLRDGITLDHCTFNLGGNPPSALFLEVPEGTVVLGAIALGNVAVRRCSFEHVTIIGTAAQLAILRASLFEGKEHFAPPTSLRSLFTEPPHE